MKYLIFLLLFMMPADDARRANEAYEKGDYAGAEQAYREALRETPDDPRLYFNLGNALAQQGKFDEAVSAYEKFKDMSDNPIDKSKADYNIGNIFGNQEKWDRAADQYRQSLRQNPADNEAKYNYELANRLLQEQQQQQQNQPDQDQQEQEDESDGEQQQQSQPEQGDQGQQDQQQNQQNQDQQQGGEQQQQQRPQPQSDMTAEEADRILNALDNKEKDLLKNYHKNQVPSNTRHAKNW